MELGESIPDDELREMIDEADRDQDGFVVFDDFYRIMKKPSDDDVRLEPLSTPFQQRHSPVVYLALLNSSPPHAHAARRTMRMTELARSENFNH